MTGGVDDCTGLRDIPQLTVIGGHNNPAREGLVSLVVDGAPSAEVVATLNAKGIRTHVRKNDYFSGNILTPLSLESCVRVSICHYNSMAEVKRFLRAMSEIVSSR